MKSISETLVTQVQRNQVETQSRVVNNYFTVIGSEGVGEPEDHYDQLETLKHAGPGEVFICTISSCPGGCYSGLLAWKNALEGTEAHTIAVLEGDLASAATILPAYFDEVIVTPFTTYMVHSASLGLYRNTAANIERSAAFQAKQMERFFREAYHGFLDEDLVQKVIDGVELYMDEYEIRERLQKRAEALQEECECCKEEGTCPSIVEASEEAVVEKQQEKPVKAKKTKKKD